MMVCPFPVPGSGRVGSISEKLDNNFYVFFFIFISFSFLSFFFFFTRFLPRFFPLHSFRLYPRNSRGFDAPRQSRRGETKRNILDSANDVLMGRKGEAIESVIVRCLRFRLFIFAGSLVRIFRTL